MKGIDRDASILITGSLGLIGSATKRLLQDRGFNKILSPTRSELDLLDQSDVFQYFEENNPTYVLMIAAKVGGISANIEAPVDFVDENMRITLNLFAACHRFKTKKNLYLGSSCIYPVNQPGLIKEECLLSGPLEPTNEGYALSKIVGLKLAKYYNSQHGLLTVCPMLSNVYGAGDHFSFSRAHVLSALVRRFVDARDSQHKEIKLWGTGIARREFLYSEDAARAILFFMDNVETSDHINVGAGKDLTIKELAELISCEVGFDGDILWDNTKPDGMLRKCLDVSKLHSMGFQAKVTLLEGVRRTIIDYETKKCNGNIII